MQIVWVKAGCRRISIASARDSWPEHIYTWNARLSPGVLSAVPVQIYTRHAVWPPLAVFFFGSMWSVPDI